MPSDSSSSLTAEERQQKLTEIRALLEAISPTPWEHVGYFNAIRHIAGCGQTNDNVPHYVVRRDGSDLKPDGARADAEFIASAPESVSWLLNECDRMHREIRELKMEREGITEQDIAESDWPRDPTSRNG